MNDFTCLIKKLAVDKDLQEELANIETESSAYFHFFKMKGYKCSIDDVESAFKDMVWFSRIGDDIDHA